MKDFFALLERRNELGNKIQGMEFASERSWLSADEESQIDPLKRELDELDARARSVWEQASPEFVAEYDALVSNALDRLKAAGGTLGGDDLIDFEERARTTFQPQREYDAWASWRVLKFHYEAEQAEENSTAAIISAGAPAFLRDTVQTTKSLPSDLKELGFSAATGTKNRFWKKAADCVQVIEIIEATPENVRLDCGVYFSFMPPVTLFQNYMTPPFEEAKKRKRPASVRINHCHRTLSLSALPNQVLKDAMEWLSRTADLKYSLARIVEEVAALDQDRMDWCGCLLNIGEYLAERLGDKKAEEDFRQRLVQAMQDQYKCLD